MQKITLTFCYCQQDDTRINKQNKIMQDLTIGGHSVRVYDSIEDLSIVRYNKFMKCLLIDAGVGGDLASVDRHLYKAKTYIRTGKTELAEMELENLRQNIMFISNSITPRLLAFSALVAEIDGKAQTDTTDGGLQKVADMLRDATRREVENAVDAQKKKIDDELHLYFADLFNDESDREYYDLLKERTNAILKGIRDGEDNAETVQRLTERVLLHVKPKAFQGKDSAEIRFEKNFEKLCLRLSEYTNQNVKSLTVMAFYNLYEYAKEQIKIKQKELKKK